MSFPNLVLSGVGPDYEKITQIALTYDNDPSPGTKPVYITRDRYDVKRELKNLNVSGGTSNRWPDIPYNAVRYVHSWIGHADVLTDSVTVRTGSSLAVQENVALIKKAAVYTATGGIEYTSSLPTSLGPDKPSHVSDYKDALEACDGWVYDVEEGTTNKITTDWVIRNINVVDNLNNTSRVTFHFEYQTLWQRLADIVTPLGP